MGDPEGLEQHYKQGHIPERKDCPVRQQTSGRVVRHHLRSDRAEKFGTLHVGLTGPFETTGKKGYRYLLIMAHR
eukprot:1738790-Prorocentrum_lima.AAC.1